MVPADNDQPSAQDGQGDSPATAGAPGRQDQAPAQATGDSIRSQKLANVKPDDDISLAEVLDLIMIRKGIDLTDDESRNDFLGQLSRGEFPPPAKPLGKLPRAEMHGDIKWGECRWKVKDIDVWVEGGKSAEQWVEAWMAHKIKRWRDLPALASYVARRLLSLSGDQDEWVHWQDQYRPWAFTGKFVGLVIWAIFVGWVTFEQMPLLGDPLVKRNDSGQIQYVPDTFQATVGGERVSVVRFRTMGAKQVFVKASVVNEDALARAASPVSDSFPDRFEGDIVAEVVAPSELPGTAVLIDRDDDGNVQPRPQPVLQYKQKDGEFVDIEGNTISPDQVTQKGVKDYSFWQFLAADLGVDAGPVRLTVPTALFALVVILPALLMIMRFVYNVASLRYKLTDSRLIVRMGFASRQEHQVRVIQINDLSVSQGPMQLLLGVGSIVVHSDDTDTPVLEVIGIRSPVAVKDRLFAVSESAKVAKRYYIESAGGQGGGGGGKRRGRVAPR